MTQGDPIRGILTSSDASGGVAIPIFDAGKLTARTIQSNEFLVITDYELYVVATGDAHFFVGADGTPGTGETVARATLAVNSRLAGSRHPGVSMGKGLTPWLIAANGQADITFSGYLQQV